MTETCFELATALLYLLHELQLVGLEMMEEGLFSLNRVFIQITRLLSVLMFYFDSVSSHHLTLSQGGWGMKNMMEACKTYDLSCHANNAWQRI